MKITVQFSVKDRMEKFFEYLKKRAKDNVHKENTDLIADFIDKFVVVELKRLNNNPQNFNEVLEVPDEVLMEPLKKVKETFDETFEKFLSTKSDLNNDVPDISDKDTNNISDNDTSDVSDTSILSEKKSGNGHKRAKKRNLYSAEKDVIKAAFLKDNGQIAEDKCVEIHETLNPEISIFQVTGYVTSLHRHIARGTLTISNLDAYINFLQSHRNLWATYKSPKYEAMRKEITNS